MANEPEGHKRILININILIIIRQVREKVKEELSVEEEQFTHSKIIAKS